ncbi:hypothetical protein [Nocardia sp. NBC_00416]|uniref:hypothetical protein n=1 Tax=Nocardia sp. NBC_00416 TaxID=2975991 RepID=UPI002E1FE84D
MSEPDIEFTLGAEISDRSIAERDLGAVTAAIVASAPENWEWAHGQFAVTVTAHRAQVTYLRGERVIADTSPSAELMAAVRRHRSAAADSPEGPWWRLVVRVGRRADGDPVTEVETDYGVEPFPPEQLLPVQAYQADLAAHPRARLPVWLAAYLGHDGRQLRPPRQAAVHAERTVGARSVPAVGELPDLGSMWSRWAVLSAVFAAIGSGRGPRIRPAVAVFESARRGGSTLCLLPGRAVLSGGVWDAPELDKAYNVEGALPDLYSGAPEWVTDEVLNPRAGMGLLTFCYWWDDGHWYRGDSPAAAELATAIPGVWTADTVVDLVSRAVGSGAGRRSEVNPMAITELVAAVELGAVGRAGLAAAFGDDDTVDIDAALRQLDMAGVIVDEVKSRRLRTEA